jgi:hypothetical protein
MTLLLGKAFEKGKIQRDARRRLIEQICQLMRNEYKKKENRKFQQETEKGNEKC